MDERKQQDILSKEYASSPTVSIDAVILTSVLDAAEKGDVVITNIHGDYLTTEIDEELHLILQGDGRVNGANGVKSIPYLRVYKEKQKINTVCKTKKSSVQLPYEYLAILEKS